MSRSLAILGCGRGLGKELVHQVLKHQNISELFLVSRQENELKAQQAIARDRGLTCSYLRADFSKEDSQLEVIDFLAQSKCHRLVYMAGGGPFGDYGTKAWKDHLWAYQVTFLFPARLLQWALNQGSPQSVQQVVLVGSSVAEQTPDPGAASYAAAKHALVGLWSSVHEENPKLDLRLFSPGYMDTPMLPPNAFPRQSGRRIWQTQEVALLLWKWMCEPSDMNQRMALNPYSSFG